MQMIPQMNVENQQILGQQQIQSLEILAMDTMELEAFLNDEYLNNPFMEFTLNHEMTSNMEKYTSVFENPYTGGNYVHDKEDEWDEGRTIIAPDRDYRKNYILSQLNIQHFSEEEWNLICFMTDCLEDDGLFELEVEEVCRLTGRKKVQIEKILEILRDLEPYGIFAKDVPSCLRKQLEMKGIQDPVLNEMISKFLIEISEGKISVISRSLKISTAEVRKYIAMISKLNPKPLSGLPDSEVNYIVPDIIFEKNKDVWEIRINDNWFGNYSINEYYLRIMEETKDKELYEYFNNKLKRVRFIFSCIEQRQKTIQRISELILKLQDGFFNGNTPLKPVTMIEFAKILEIHPSTVTRAVKRKYLQCPKGTISMKSLFSNAVTSNETGADLSAVHIKERIRELVDKEDRKKPLSDAQIVELLKMEGIKISRRTVAKYRDELWIKSSYNRKLAP